MIEIFQFTKLDAARFAGFLSHAAESRVNIIVDVEDSVQNPSKPQDNVRLKGQAREAIASVIQNGAEGLGIRINAASSDEFHHDIAMMRQLSGYCWRYVIIPKCEQQSDIEYLRAIFSQEEILTDEWVPIIETQAGMRNLRNIVAAPMADNIRRIAFGHSDLNYDAGYFPFFHETTHQYWHWVNELTTIVQNAGYQYFHSAFLGVHNTQGFKSVLSNIARRCPRGFSQTTLSPKQSEVCLDFVRGAGTQQIAVMTEFDEKEYTNEERINIARSIIHAWSAVTSERHTGLCFDNGRLIAPHEYLAAQRFLQSMRSA